MATSVNKNTFISTYKDDYLDSDGYYRILFNSGKKLQARELTQSQTILQKQIERMGNNLFKDGTAIQFGGHSIDNRYEYIKLDDDLSNVPNPSNSLIGEVYEGQTSSVQFEILEVVAPTGSDPTTLYVRYISTKNNTDALSSSGNTVTVRASSGEDLTSAGNPNLKVKSAVDISGPGSRFVLGKSIYYVKGFFVFIESTSKIISKYTNNPDVTVVLKINEQVFTATDDDGLYDNQGPVPNVTAPGADRYKIALTLDTKSNMAVDDNYIELCNIVGGIIIGNTNVIDNYKIPNDLINQRIHENSGDYIVENFRNSWEEDSDQNFLQLILTDGVAVVKGQRVTTAKNNIFRIPKAQTTLTEVDELVSTPYGNYVMVADSGITGMPNLAQLDSQTIMDSASFAGNAIGGCKVRYISEDGANYRYYLFDISMNTGKDFRDAKSIGTDSGNYFNPILDGGKTNRIDAQNNDLLFKLPYGRPKALSNADIDIQRYFSQTTLNGTVTLNTTGDEVFTDDDEWLITDSNGILSPTILLNDPTNDQATISGLPDGNGTITQTINFATFVRKPNVNKLSKTLTTKFIDGLVESNGENLKFIDLHRADIYDFSAVLETGDSTNDFTANFTLDNGQRDNFYAKGKVILKPGLSVPTPGDAGGAGLRVFYRYFEHSGPGHYFDVGSYGDLNYKDIPEHTLNTGKTINLRDYMDFRPVQDSNGLYTDTVTGAKVFELPTPTSVLDVDVEYYLPRTDRLVAGPDGFIQYIEGNSSFSAPPPKTPVNNISLYYFALGPNTLDRTDLASYKQKHRRFTMKDIGLLSDRISRVEEITSLSLLELHTKNLQVLDENLLDRTKSGFVVDNFGTNLFKDEALSSSAIDFKAGKLYPQQVLRNIGLFYDSDHPENVNVVRKGDYIFPTYTEEVYIDQSVVSKDFSLNEFNVQSYQGSLQLSPSSDTWYDVYKEPRNVTDLGTVINGDNVSWYDKHTWNWNGKSLDELNVGDQTKTSKKSNTNYWLTVSEAGENVQYTGQDTFLFEKHIDTMRSNKIYFKANGLQPNARHFAFFNGINVSDYCSDSDFYFFSDYDSDYGDQFANFTSHPNGAADALVSDEFGTLTGSFFIPNNDTLSFPTGNGRFEFLNVSLYKPQNSFSNAYHSFMSAGTMRHVQPEFTTTRVLDVKGGSKTDTPPSRNDNDNSNSNTGGGTRISDENRQVDGSWSNNHSNYGGYDPTGTGNFNSYDDWSSGWWCLLEDMKVMLNGKLSYVTNVKVGDTVSNSVVSEVIQKHMRTSYYLINNELKITNDHPVLVNGNWKNTEDVQLGDYINNVKVVDIKFIEKTVPTVYIGIEDESYEVYCNNNIYTVHGNYKQLSRKAS